MPLNRLPLALLLSLVLLASGCDTSDSRSGDWTLVGLQGPDIGPISSILVHPDDPDLLLVGTQSNFSLGLIDRIYRSEDGGRSWATVYEGDAEGGGGADLVLDPHDPDVIYATPGGLIKSTDRGRTWQPADAGVDYSPYRLDTRAGGFAADPNVPGRLYLGVVGFDGPRGLWRSDDGGVSWRLPYSPGKCTASDLDSPYCHLSNGVIQLTVSPAGVVFASTAWTGEVLRSEDGGDSWTTIHRPEGEYFVSPLLIDRNAPSTLYGRVHSGLTTPGGLVSSRDGGESWTLDTDQFPLTGEGDLLQTNDGGLYLSSLVRDNSPDGTVWHRPAGATSWTDIGLPSGATYFGLAEGPDGTIYAGGDGLWRLTPGSE